MGQLLSSRDVARQLSVSVKTVLRLVARGELHPSKVGNQFRFSQEEVDGYLKRTRIAK